MRVLVVNAGSTTLKLRVLDDDDRLVAQRDLPSDAAQSVSEGVLDLLRQAGPVDAVGHRVVHGGPRFAKAVRLDPEVESYLGSLSELAPLHQPPALRSIDTVRRLLPQVPNVACFDTAFHAGMSESAATYAIPNELKENGLVRRYGFHGLSHSYAAVRASQLTGRAESGLRVVSCHLGGGASLAAVQSGRSIDTTMGFTPLDGLVMATRSGSIDPGLLLWLQDRHGFSPSALMELLDRRSGLLALAGSSDMPTIIASAQGADPRARAAIDVYLHHLRCGIASMTASLGGLDVLVFTGGVGENAAPIRDWTCAGLGFLGVSIDQDANLLLQPDADISSQGALVSTVVIRAREDLQIAREVRDVLTSQ